MAVPFQVVFLADHPRPTRRQGSGGGPPPQDLRTAGQPREGHLTLPLEPGQEGPKLATVGWDDTTPIDLAGDHIQIVVGELAPVQIEPPMMAMRDLLELLQLIGPAVPPRLVGDRCRTTDCYGCAGEVPPHSIL